ncbi:unnamed protein product [Moneuplotes crassus]|uniref:Carboxypeptidase n=2 Tax=Euplotes crassus TaxID=5936 RepID=A0AAD1XE38_EUPCR|nr:unnamed protein product [Moneuplotes crassus]
MKTALFLLALICFAAADDIFLGEDHEAGLIELEKGDDMFYWLFRSRDVPEKDPLVLWLTGGPGCSSEVALFYENGPFIIQDDLTLEKNQYSWNEVSNLLYIDQPLGTGFSRTDKPDHYARNEKMVAKTMYKFLTLFIEKYPEFRGRDFFITGESYAGHYIPAITAYIAEQGNPDINLVSSAIGNGLVDPYVQYPEYNKFSYENNLIGGIHSTILTAGFKLCQGLIWTKIWPLALMECQIMTTTILGFPLSPNFNVYDIRRKCEVPPLCYDFALLDKFIDLPEVREFLGVGKRAWSSCNQVVHTFMLGDWMVDLSSKVKYALENDIKILVYSGDKDFICNWRGGEAWTHALEWQGREDFHSNEYQKWTVDDEEAGEFKQANGLTFLRVYDAGHMVPMDQPKRSLEMLKKFINLEF